MLGKIKEFNNLVKYWKNHPIASKHLNATIIRFLKWQMSSAIVKAPILWPWIEGSKLVIEKGMTGATMNMYCGLHEFNDMGFLLHFLKSDDHFVDIGANIGTYTILASKIVGAKTLAVEPIPSTHEKLVRNIILNELQEKVHAECVGIGLENGKNLKFIADQDTTNRIAPEYYSGLTIDVPIKNLDTLVENFHAALWKIDVEGFEDQVIGGANHALKSKKLLAVELEGSSDEIRKVMIDAGFLLYSYDPLSREFSSSRHFQK